MYEEWEGNWKLPYASGLDSDLVVQGDENRFSLQKVPGTENAFKVTVIAGTMHDFWDGAVFLAYAGPLKTSGIGELTLPWPIHPTGNPEVDSGYFLAAGKWVFDKATNLWQSNAMSRRQYERLEGELWVSSEGLAGEVEKSINVILFKVKGAIDDGTASGRDALFLVRQDDYHKLGNPGGTAAGGPRIDG